MFGTVAAIASSIVSSWMTNRAKKQERKDRLEDAKVRAKITQTARESKQSGNYDIEAQKAMQHSWKDEYLVILLSLPFIGSFIPGIQDSVVIGWEYIAKAPPWYQFCFIGIIVATFGLRWMTKTKAAKAIGMRGDNNE